MKCTRFLPFVGLGTVFVCLQAHAALTGLNAGLPSDSPYYSDFFLGGLKTTYTYSAGTGLGTFNVSNVSGTQGETYTSSSMSAGSHGTYQQTQFQGSFTMMAIVKQVAGEWQVQSGSSFTIKGSLLNAGNTSDVLLTGTLQTGVGSFGWGTKMDNEFDFLFNTAAGGTDNSAILADFFGAGTGQGAIKFHEGTGTTYNGNLATTWASAGGGNADVFVPEPVFYAFAASGMAMFALVLTSRKPGRVTLLAA